MKKLIGIMMIVLIFTSCNVKNPLSGKNLLGSTNKYPTKKDKLELVYKAIVLKDKKSRNELNKATKDDKQIIAEAEKKENKDPNYKFNSKEQNAYEFEQMIKFCEDEFHELSQWNKESSGLVPPLNEILAKNGEPVSFHFRLKLMQKDRKRYTDILSEQEKGFTGIGIKRQNGYITDIVRLENGKIVEILEEHEYNYGVFSSGNPTKRRITYYRNNMPYIVKKYKLDVVDNEVIDEVEVNLETYKNKRIKKQYLKSNDYPEGIILNYAQNGMLLNLEKVK